MCIIPTTLIPLLSYVLISTFTPGPSNISTAAGGVLYGYKKTLTYQLGLAVGVFMLMFLSGAVSVALLSRLPGLEPALRYIGAAYILYLAYKILRASYDFSTTQTRPLGFWHGVALQALNPKLYVYAFTLFTGFLATLTNNLALVALAAFGLAVISLIATFAWALFGTAIKTYLHNPRHLKIVNLILSLTLVYTAAALVGVV